MATVSQMVACDYMGIASGNDVSNKFEVAGWHDTKAAFVDAPMIDELPVCVECKLISYDSESCVLVCDIVNVSVDESVLDENGKVDIKKVEPIAFDPFTNTYVKCTDVVGQAFSAGMVLK